MLENNRRSPEKKDFQDIKSASFVTIKLSFNSLWIDRKREKFAQGQDSQHCSLPRHKKSALGWLLKLIFTFGSPRALTLSYKSYPPTPGVKLNFIWYIYI